MKAALLQLNVSDDPKKNLVATKARVADAAAAGAGFVLTPEVTNCVSMQRAHQQDVLAFEHEDMTLRSLRAQASELKIWLLIGSLALKTDDPDGRFANRSFLIGPDAEIAARYDKIHMFDVAVSEKETYRESFGYRPGEEAGICTTPFAKIGMTICYDLRFPSLYRQLAKAGAEVLTIPSAFSPVTGAAHWETLLRARAIETGCYVLAPAQTGTHAAQSGRQRTTYGHTMAINPWGEIEGEAGDTPGMVFIDIDRQKVIQARSRIPSLHSERDFAKPV
ncbi:MAG: carbon-nitrogen hydrolase family protein [Pseudomonadota bacterium]